MFDLEHRLKETISSRRLTMLGVGPMSLTVTREAVALANKYRTPIALIPSRRQVDSAEFGGGYVEGWSTETFSHYVRSIDSGGFALLSRDHSGPWQGSTKQANDVSLPVAMDEAKASLANDIASGFNILHIDPSPALTRGFSYEEVTKMAVELIEFCVGKMESPDQVVFEVGTDEQDISPDPLSVTEHRIEMLFHELDLRGLPRPLFYVAQTGTKTLGTRNFGSFDQPFTVEGSLPATAYLPQVLSLLADKGLFLKEHNADYLSDKSLKWHRRFGIQSANVAPEFGVAETRVLMRLLRDHGLDREYDDFLDLVVEGGNWSKWIPEGAEVPEEQKVVIAGHYHFSNPRVVEIRDKLSHVASRSHVDSEDVISNEVRASIDRYLVAFGYGVSRD